ncbi:unnamed protein product [Zymoseptoria tritici ST99CH_3D7]|uniref:Phosphoglycerate mutase n=1 Tax=Zymoseptoria tritici (strain ST99CH_3D7) TaxID=1276538 RepID=A0A1X7RDJ0_ZYMT9|nr:unnamed protein product [Zymoseptoria tritici ST99CH_3D7]
MAPPQAPAVVIVARHGMRLDAADQAWHLSTPTPYDPPLTYGGWNQCRALGMRIASLLDAREQESNAGSGHSDNGTKRKKKKHKVVIHTSPFLRCLQTSVAISAGMAQFEAPRDRTSSSRPRTPSQMHSASPKLRAMDSTNLHSLAPIAEPRHDLAHDVARRALGSQKRYRKTKLRVDAFLGEWLNPQYFDHITPPPPSSMMVATAKAELLQTEEVDTFTPTTTQRTSGGSLWNGANNRAGSSRESPLDDWSHVTNALLHAPIARRDRSNSASSVGSNESSGRKSPFRPKSPFRHGHGFQPLTSTMPKVEASTYYPPQPHYAISNSDTIPRGYISHARVNTVNVDYHWDSSRHLQEWGDGGQFGEEWSSMHRRFRRGLNGVMEWYSQHGSEERGEDALGLEQVMTHESTDDDDQEDLVVIMVTHGAGCNALIGALTNQPVLMDVGMASLTMAVRKENAPTLVLSQEVPEAALTSPTATSPASPDPAAMINGHDRRRSSLDIGLSAMYEMKLVSSSEHLRAGVDPTKAPTKSIPANMKNAQDALAKYKRNGAASHAAAGAGIDASWDLGEPKRNSSNSSLGSMRRPSAPAGTLHRSDSPSDRKSPAPTFSTGLWTPPSGRGTPKLDAMKQKEEKSTHFPQLDGGDRSGSPGSAPSPPASRPASATGKNISNQADGSSNQDTAAAAHDAHVSEAADDVGDLPRVSEKLPQNLSRGLSQKGLWGRQTSGDRVPRKHPVDTPKRRWTVNEND